MNNDSLFARSIADLAQAVGGGEIEAADLLATSAMALEAADSGPEPVHAFLSIDPEGALGRVPAGGPTGPLAGIPVAVKDNISTVDFPTTCGSLILEGYRPPYDATVVRRLRDAGALIIGKSNLDEFAMGSSTEFSAYGLTRNPLDRARVPGGSSGGSAAAVAAGIVPAALGSETGGSVRQPAAFCGIVGVKPTYGRVSRYGLVAYASSLDHVAAFGKTVGDAAALLRVVSGHDPLDSTSAARPQLDFSDLDGGVEGMVIGVPEEYFPHTLDSRISRICRDAIRVLERLGAEVREVSLPNTAHAIPTYYIIAPAEASSNLARYDGVRYGARATDAGSLNEMYDRTRSLFGVEVKRRIMLGTYVLSSGYYDAYYAQAQRVRRLIAQDFQHVFASGVDALFTPTTPTPAFRIGEHTADPYEMYLSDVFTVTANLVGIPAMSLPVGTVDGLPIGGQLMARHWEEAKMMRIARALERELSIADR